MTVRGRFHRAGTTAVTLLLVVMPAPLAGEEPGKSRPGRPVVAQPVVAQLRLQAETAERNGDWEAAFAAYCQLQVADRGAPDVRDKLNAALRRVQQLRRHSDPQYLHFVQTTTLADAIKLFGEVLTKVPALYVDRDRARPQILWEHALEELARAVGGVAFRQAFLDGASADAVERFSTSLRVYWPKQTITSAADARVLLRKLVAEAQSLFTVRTPSALVLELICGACGGLDEYTVYLNPSEWSTESLPAPADLTALGVYLRHSDGGLIIAGVAPGSWAAFHTPLRRGDRVIRLNGRSTETASPSLTAEALCNPIDGFHELEVAVGEPDSPSVLVRLPTQVPSVYGIGTAGGKDGVGYVRIGLFTASTARELDEAIATLRSTHGVRVLVLDVRGNMGGSFLAGVEATKRFLPAGVIVTTRGQFAQVDNRPFSSDSGPTAHDLPLVLLVDAETASAAEVMAAALKDHNRATLIGMPTFGKGAIQYPVRLDSLDDRDARGRPKTNKSGGVRLTIARLFSPRGTAINGVGVTPDILEADPRRQLELAVDKAIELLPLSPIPPVSPVSPMSPTSRPLPMMP